LEALLPRRVVWRTSEPATVASPRDMALIRLRGALDAAMRGPLSVRHLVALAGRIEGVAIAPADLSLLQAFDAVDLRTANMSAADFIMGQAAVYRAVAAVMLHPMRGGNSGEAIARAAAVVVGVSLMLRERLRALPDAEELARLGRLFDLGDMTAADLAVIRAIPGPHLRAHSAVGDWRTFVDYRLMDD
jgi:hypothetical protein